jgi:hypothetical protein
MINKIYMQISHIQWFPVTSLSNSNEIKKAQRFWLLGVKNQGIKPFSRAG